MPPKHKAKDTRSKVVQKRDSKQSERSKSPDNSRINSSASGNKSANRSSLTQLQAQAEQEMQLAFNSITEEVLNGGLEATAVTNIQKRQLVQLMTSKPQLFQKCILLYIERLLTLDVDDAYLKNFFRLLEKVFIEFVKPIQRQNDPLKTNGPLLMKSILRFCLQSYNMPKLMTKVQFRFGTMLAMIVAVTSENVKVELGGSQVPMSANRTPVKPDSASQLDVSVDGDQGNKKIKLQRKFNLLNMSQQDRELRVELENTILQMLSTNSVTNTQAHGIQMAALITDGKSDPIFIQMMKLLVTTKSTEIRKRIIKSIPIPYSNEALAFLGKRLRDVNKDVVVLVFKQLTSNDVTLADFPTAEARMLLLTEGLTAKDEEARNACIEFLTPSVLKHSNDLAALFKMIDAKLAFVNQYYNRMPCLLTLAILKILPDEMTLVNYLDTVVMAKLKNMAARAARAAEAHPDGDQEMQEGDEVQLNDLEDITFEELLILRLTYEINQSTKDMRLEEYLDRLNEILPEYDMYRQILFAIAMMPEPDLPHISAKENEIKPYPKGQHGFARRAILGEWVKFSLQMNIQEEIIRQNLVTLCFELISKIDYSYADYEHLLRQKKQLLTNDTNPQLVGDLDEDDSDCFGLEESNSQQIEIVIRTFENMGTARSLQEYCKPFALEQLTLDFDDVCHVAINVAKRLLGQRVDEFQRDMVQAISDIKDNVEDPAVDENPFGPTQPAQMIFSQVPGQPQPQVEPQGPSFKALKEDYMKKLEANIDQLQHNEDEDDFDMDSFNKKYKKVQKFVSLIEEVNLKEKLCFKRALIMCRGLLKQCRLADVNDHNVIAICETLIAPAIDGTDHENLLLAIECIGLLTILDKQVFMNYSEIFRQILTEEVSIENKREKVIAIKSVVDGLIVHGICDQKSQELFDLITGTFLTIKEKVLRQVSIEGVCKMLFSTKLCDENNKQHVESILAQLIFQLFDKKYNFQNSLVRSILTVFFRNFVLFSEARCFLMLNAVTKVIYSIIRSKFGLKQNVQPKKLKVDKVQQKGRKVPPGKHHSESESEFDEGQDFYSSDDSECIMKKIRMKEISKNLDSTLILQRCLMLLQRSYINPRDMHEQHAVFKLKQELTVVFLARLLKLNNESFKKTQVVKDVIVPVLEHIGLEHCDNLDQLNVLQELWGQNSNLLVQKSAKVSKFDERLNKRILDLEDLQDDDAPQQDVVMEEEKNPLWHDDYEYEQLEEYWQDYIEDVVADKAQDDDRELVEQNRVWLHLSTKQYTVTASGTKMPMASPVRSAKKSQPDIPQKSTQQMATTRARRNRRSPPRQGQGSKKLNMIVEESPVSMISNSAKPKDKNVRISDMIKDPRSDISEEADDESEEGYGESEFEEGKFDKSQDVLPKASQVPGLGELSKQMAQSFANSKKKRESMQSQKWKSGSGQMRFAAPTASSKPAFTSEKKAPSQVERKSDVIMEQPSKKSKSQRSSSKDDSKGKKQSSKPKDVQVKEPIKTEIKDEPVMEVEEPVRANMPMRTRRQRNQSRDVSQDSKSSAEQVQSSEESVDLFDVFHGKATKKKRQKKTAQQQLSKSIDQEGKKEKKADDLPNFGNAASKQLNRSAVTNDKRAEKENIDSVEAKSTGMMSRNRSRKARINK